MTDVDLAISAPLVSTGAGDQPASGRRLYPRPQLRRRQSSRLDGPWAFRFDDGDRGRAAGWASGDAYFGDTITVPFPPESPLSGIGDPGFHPVVWYGRQLTADDLHDAGWATQGERLMLHFGAVDYRAEVWLAGVHLGRHEGGHSPFSFDITDIVRGEEPLTLIVRAEDDPRDVGQPRGKQDWRLDPHGIWYRRTTGIWQPVWLEAVPSTHITDLAWQTDLNTGTVTLDVAVNARPLTPVELRIRLRAGADELVEASFMLQEPRSSLTVTLPRQTNGQDYESLLWTPETPHLIDATIDLYAKSAIDSVKSYLGLRDVGWADGHFLLNDRPYFVRGVLAQGYWPESHLAPPSDDAITAEAQLIKDLGFNMVRIHQKFEDPRFLAEADRIGLLVWAETPSAYEFSETAIERLTREWLDIVRRDRSHPSIVTWVPLNESWGVQHIAHDPAQLHYAQALYHLTKALDPTRPVVSNDGWEHAESDIITVHEYAVSGPEVAANYSSAEVVEELLSGIGPLGRRMRLVETVNTGQPVIVSEFGGISYAPAHNGEGWGYATVQSADDYEALLRELFHAIHSSPVLAGFCYTQLTDTLQEANGLADGDRLPKLPVSTIREIVRGDGLDRSSHRRPKRPIERPLDLNG